MANRYGLGAAEFFLTANDEQMREAFAQSEASAKRWSAKIAQAVKEAEAAHNAGAKSIIASIKAHNDALDQNAKKAEENAKKQQASKQAMFDVGKQFLAAGAAIAGVTVGLQGLIQVTSAAIEANKKMMQAQFELNQTFKLGAKDYNTYAKTLADQTKFTTTEVRSAISAQGVLAQNYGLTTEQVKALVDISAVYATKTGRDLEQSSRDIQAAVRGEGEAVEKLGLTLGRDFVRNAGLMTDAQKKMFFTLTDQERAIIILNAAMKQSAEFQGIIAERAKSDLNAYDQWEKAVKLLSESFGAGLNNALQLILPPMTAVALGATKLGDAFNGVGKIIGIADIALSGFVGNLERAQRLLGSMPDVKRVIQGIPGVPGLDTEQSPEDNAAMVAALENQRKKNHQAQLARGTQLEAQLKERIKQLEREEKVVEKAAQVAIDSEQKRYDAQVALTQLAQHRAEEAANTRKDVALAAIKEEEDAFKESSDRKLDQLRYEKEEKLRHLSDGKDAAVAAAEEERDTVVNSLQEQIEAANFQREAQLRGIDAVKDATLEALETQKTAQLDAIEEQVAAAQVGKETEVRAAEDAKEQQLRIIAEEQEASDDYYDSRIEQANAVKDNAIENAEDEKDAQLRALEEEIRARDRSREQEDRQLEDRAKAIQESRKKQDQALDDAREKETEALQDSKEQQLRILEETREAQLEDIAERQKQTIRSIDDRREAELRAIADRHEATTRQLDAQEDAELRALQLRDRTSEESYKQEVDRIKDAAEIRLDAIEDQRNTLESSHRQELARIDDEKRSRLDEINSRIRAVNDLQRAFQGENKLKDLGQELDIAKRKGDLTAIAKIEEQIRRETISQTLQTAEQRLQTEKSAIETELEQRKDAAQERFRIAKEALDREKELVTEGRDAALEAIKQRQDALKDSLQEEQRAIKERYDQQRQLLKDTYDAEKRLISDRYESEKEAAQDRFESEKRLVADRYDDEKRRIDDLFDKSARAIEERFERTERDIEERRRLEDRQLEDDKRRIEDRRREEDEASEDRKREIQEQYDEEKERVQDAHKATIDSLREQREEAKRVFEDRKRAVDDAYDLEKRRIEDVYDNAQTGVFAQLRKQREETERAYAARADVINKAYDAEKLRIDDVYNGPNGVIPQLRKAIDDARTKYDERKKLIEAAYKDEQRQIEDTYSGPNGLIKKHEQMVLDASKQYAARRVAVEAAYKAERAEIYELYSNPVTGLIKKQKDAHDQIMDDLNKQKTRWKEWSEAAQNAIKDALEKKGGLNEFIEKVRELEAKGYIIPAGQQPNQGGQRPPGSGSEGSSGGGGVPGSGKPYSVLFGYDQPYNGPYGGAAWPGGPVRHRGIDLTLPGPDGGRGSAVGAFREGTVVGMSDESAGGKGITIQGKDGLFEYYGHFDSRNVHMDQPIKRGDVLGTLGRTGLASNQTAHLHYEVRKNPGGDPVGSTIDPRGFMNGQTNTAGMGEDFAEFMELRPFGPHGALVRIKTNVVRDWFTKALQVAQQERFQNPDLFARQMRHESDNFAPDVISGKRKSEQGAIGIAQFVPTTAQMLGVNPYNPIDSLHGAAKYMKKMVEQYGNIRNALWGYNAGEGNLRAGIMPDETRRYLEILQPYKNGHLVMEPTLMIGTRTGQMGIAGETGQPERLLGVAATAAYDTGGSTGSMQRVEIPITIGNQIIETMWITGLKLTVSSSRHIGLPGITIGG